MEIRSYRDLVVWKKSMSLVTEVYEATAKFPTHEKFGLLLQIRRCAISIPSNIAEGYGRYHTADYVRFLQISLGSLYELQTQLEISVNLRYINNDQYNQLILECNEIEKMLNTLISKLKLKH
ncbi:MAG: four helix bundle protein [Bacteroidales bacterium]|nr:four helix bundle protein [Bacteroidales bacterium]